PDTGLTSIRVAKLGGRPPYAAFGLPPRGGPSISLIPPRRLWSRTLLRRRARCTGRQDQTRKRLHRPPPPHEIGHLCCARPTPPRKRSSPYILAMGGVFLPPPISHHVRATG